MENRGTPICRSAFCATSWPAPSAPTGQSGVRPGLTPTYCHGVRVHTEAVEGPQGAFVVRAERRGVPTHLTVRWGAGVDAVLRLRRLVRGDRTWLIAVRPRAVDPQGVPCYTVVVPNRQAVNEVMEHVVQTVRRGQLQISDRWRAEGPYRA